MSSASFRSALSGTGADIGGERDDTQITEQVKGRIDAKRLQGMRAAMRESLEVRIGSGELGVLIDAYLERAALIVVNDQMEKQGAEIAPYWAHHMMARVLAKGTCDLITSKNPDTCRGSSLCITEYCPHCYAKVWWESQHKHKAQRHRDGMPKGTK